MSAVNCSHFDEFNDTYLATLRNETGFNTTVLEQCRTEICLAIYGSGTPDISGIGVFVACCVETGLGILLGLAIWTMDRVRKNQMGSRLKLLDEMISDTYLSFYNSAIGFSFAIQLACCIIILARGAQGLGNNGIIVQLAWLISTATLLPLIAPTLLLRGHGPTPNQPMGRRRAALAVFVSVLLAFYPDCQLIMVVLFAANPPPELVGGALPTEEENTALDALCLPSGAPQIADQLAILIVALVGWFIILLLFAAGWAALLLFELWARRERRIGNGAGNKALAWWAGFKNLPVLSLVVVILPSGISIALLVEALQLRKLQQNASGTSYVDNQWEFGQIAAIAMYGPVVLDFLAGAVALLKGGKRVFGYDGADPGVIVETDDPGDVKRA